MKIDISAEPATPPETGVKVHVRKGAEIKERNKAWCPKCGARGDDVIAKQYVAGNEIHEYIIKCKRCSTNYEDFYEAVLKESD
jgi:DNA-directed RNA polymerase subunit M/transcription elongation factor TFIIS